MHAETITDMKMPGQYVDMNCDEIQYDGGMSDKGRFWTIIGITAAAIATIVVSTILISRGGGAVVAAEGGMTNPGVITEGPLTIKLPPVD